MPFHVFVNGCDDPDVDAYIYDVLDEMFESEPERDIDVFVDFLTLLEDNADGFCWGDSDEVSINIACGGEFEAGVYTAYDRDAQMLSLAHELVHAKQYIQGEINGHDRVWRSGQVEIDCSGMNVLETPWESEAETLESALFSTYWKNSK